MTDRTAGAAARLVAVALVSTVWLGSTGARAGAQEAGAGDEGRIPREAVVAAVELGRTTERLTRIDLEIADVQRTEDVQRVELAAVEERIAEHRDRVAALVEQIRARAAAVYAQGGSGPLAPLRIDNRQDLQSGRSYTAAVNSVDGTLVDELRAAQEELERDRAQRVAAVEELQRTREGLLARRADVEALRLQEQMLIDRWGAVSVMGPAQLDAAQIASFYASTGVRPNLPAGLSIHDVARLFVEEGALAGVRGDVAFAQSMIETGSFTEFRGNNFSGIGVCDSCTGGYLFDGAREGVRAQMQLLRNYADPASRAADFTVPLSPVLYGTDPVESAHRFDTFFLKGAAPVWNEMGGGNWATDPEYAGKVLRMYARMLAHADAGTAGDE